MQSITDWSSFLINLSYYSTLMLLIPIITAIYYKKYWNKPLLAAFLYGVFTFGIKFLAFLNPFFHHLCLFSLFLLIPAIYFWTSQFHSIRIPLRKSPYLWIILGLFFSFPLSLFLFIAGTYLFGADSIIYYQLLSLKIVLDSIGYCLVAYGFSFAYYARFIRLSPFPYVFALKFMPVERVERNQIKQRFWLAWAFSKAK